MHFPAQNPPSRCLECGHLSEAGREEPQAWGEPQFSPLLPGREWKLGDVGGSSIAEATSQGVARDPALHSQAGDSSIAERCGV